MVRPSGLHRHVKKNSHLRCGPALGDPGPQDGGGHPRQGEGLLGRGGPCSMEPVTERPRQGDDVLALGGSDEPRLSGLGVEVEGHVMSRARKASKFLLV
jgi:hypothetical protein